MQTRKIVGSENINGLTKKVIAVIPEFLERIAEHGEDNPVLSKRIERRLRISDVSVRAIANILRTFGCPVASGTKGYFMATNNAELEGTRKGLDTRIAGISRARAGIEHPVFEGWTIERLYNEEDIIPLGANLSKED